VKAVEAGVVLRNELTPTQTAFLIAHRSAEVRVAAASVFKRAAAGDRRAVLQRYLAGLDLRGSAVRGRTTYQARCASCHEPGPDGSSIGPSMATVKSSTREEILTHLLDPNRTVDVRYRLYLVETKDGRSVTGIIQSESETSVTLRPPFGQASTLLRSNITRLQGLEQSMMPDGLEDGLSLQDMADLLQFILG
jgi:putative heme-binding domain-containing protein